MSELAPWEVLKGRPSEPRKEDKEDDEKKAKPSRSTSGEVAPWEAIHKKPSVELPKESKSGDGFWSKLNEQAQDIASFGTGVADFAGGVIGGIGGGLNEILQMGPRNPPKASNILRGMHQGAQDFSVSGLHEDLEGHRERPGYKAIMKPFELMDRGIQGAAEASKAIPRSGILGSERTGPAYQEEFAKGTQLAGEVMLPIPLLGGRPAPRPGTPRAYRELGDRRSGMSERAIDETRSTYPVERPQEVAPWDAARLRDPLPEGFEPEYRPEVFQGPEELLTEGSRGGRERIPQDLPETMGQPPETLVGRQALELGREQDGLVPLDDLTGRGARGEEVRPQQPGPIDYRAYDPSRIQEQVAAADRPGFLRSAEEVMRARELAKTEAPTTVTPEMPPKDRLTLGAARFPDNTTREFTNTRLENVLLRAEQLVREKGVGAPNPVRAGLMAIESSTNVPFYKELSAMLLKDKTFKPDFESAMFLDQGHVGQYKGAAHKIRMDNAYLGSEQVFLHEAVHARTFGAIFAHQNRQWFSGNKDRLYAKAKEPVENIFKLFESLQKESDAFQKSGGLKKFDASQPRNLKDSYGMTDVHEFVSEGFTNPAFQAKLAQLEVPKALQKKGVKYYWDAFLHQVAKLMGFAKPESKVTYLSELLRSGSELMNKVGSEGRIYYADMIDPNLTLGARLDTPTKITETMMDAHKQLELDRRPIEAVMEDIMARVKRGEKVEDFAAQDGPGALMGGLTKNMLQDTTIKKLMADKGITGTLVKWTVDQFSMSERKAQMGIRQSTHDALAKMRGLFHSKKSGRPLLGEMLDTWFQNIGVRDLTRADFRSERQWDAYSAYRAADDRMLQLVNDERAKAVPPLPPIARIPSHYRGMWEGDYRVVVTDIATGDKKAAFSAPNLWVAKHMAKRMQRQQPTQKIVYEHVKMDKYGLGDLSGFEEAIKVMSQKDDPVVAALQQTYSDILRHRGFGRTGVQRKGVAGFLGSEGGEKGMRNMDRAMVQHIHQVHRYVSTLEKQRIWSDLQKVPPEIRGQLQSTYDFLFSYYRKSTGQKLNKYSGGLDRAAEWLSRSVGMGERGPVKSIREVAAAASMYFLTTPRFLFSQVPQSLYMVPKLVQQVGMAEAGKSYWLGLQDTVVGRKNPTTKAALEWAEKNGYLDPTIRQALNISYDDVPTGSRWEVIKQAASYPAAFVEHHIVRTPAFLSAERALRTKIPDQTRRFEVAAEMADDYMVNYSRTHGAMVYDQAGLIGEAARPLKQFSHNMWGQFLEYSQSLKNKGEVAPLASFLGIQASVAGLKGLMLVAEATAVVTLINAMFDLDIPTPEELLLKTDWHNGLIFGGASTVLQQDISSSVGAPGLPQMFSFIPISFGHKIVTDVGAFLTALAKGEATDAHYLRAALAVTPNLFHEYIKNLYTPIGDPQVNPNDDQLRGNYRRSGTSNWDLEGERFWSAVTGARPLNEARINAAIRATKQALARDMQGKMNALDAIADQVINGQEISEELVEKYVEQGGDPRNLVRSLQQRMKERSMTYEERQLDTKRLTPSQIHRLDTMKEFLDGAMPTPPDMRGFDPDTGEIKPISASVITEDDPDFTVKGEPGYDRLPVVSGRLYNDTTPPASWAQKLPPMSTDDKGKEAKKLGARSQIIGIDTQEFVNREVRKRKKSYIPPRIGM